MRIKAVLIIAAVAATALPATAQSYSRNCNAAKNSNQVGGMLLGGILGGVLGSNVAGSGHRHDGTAVGAVLGGIVGSGIGGQSVNCGPPNGGYSSGPNYGGQYAPGYSPSPYSQQPAYGYGPAPAGAYPVDPGYSSYGEDDRYYDGPYGDSGSRGNANLYRNDRGSYRRDDDYAGRDCREATQITRLPDGTVIRRPVEACRDAYSGDWQVRD